MSDNANPDVRPSRRVIRWDDDQQEMSLADELTRCPYRWGVIAERIPSKTEAERRAAELRAELGNEQFDVKAVDVGGTFEVKAKFARDLTRR